MLHSLLCVALAGTKLLQNDGFTGSGTVNSAVSFLDYEGPAVLFTPDGGYPLKLIGIDVLSVTYNQGAPGEIGAYQLDIWTEDGSGFPFDAGSRPPAYRDFIQLTTSTSMFNRITVSPAITVNSGRLFVSVGEQQSTSQDQATVAIDSTALVPGANWFRSMIGTFTPIDLPDGGFYRGISHNWIIRAVLEVPDVAVTVTSVFPNSGPTNMANPVLITGTNFEVGAQAFVGTTSLTITGSTPPTAIQATVPPGLAAGKYDVKVQNPGGNFGVLTMGYEVLQADGGSGTGGGAGGGSGGSGGGAGGGSGGSGGGSGGSGGGSTAALRLDDITPTDGFNEETTKVVLTGDGFKDGAQVLIGPNVLDVVTVKSAAVINADVPPGIARGVYDVTVINLDGERAKLVNAFTVNAGTRTKGGCGCSQSDATLWLAAAALLFLGARRRPPVSVRSRG